MSFKADSAESIIEHTKQPKSKLVYIVVAQTMNKNVTPFILQIFGTDNKFKTTSVLKRWIYTENELRK